MRSAGVVRSCRLGDTWVTRCCLHTHRFCAAQAHSAPAQRLKGLQQNPTSALHTVNRPRKLQCGLEQGGGQQGQRSLVQARAVQVDLLLGGVSGVPGWVLAAVLLVGMLLGLLVSKLASSYLRKQTDPYWATLENAELRAKVEELQQLLLKLQPLAYKSMRLRFTKGINKAVILGMVDTMLANKEVNIWWLPDQIERVFYFNMMTLMLSVLDEVVDGMSINLAGHNVRLQLTYLDVAPEGEAASSQAQRTEAMLQRAMQPPTSYPPP